MRASVSNKDKVAVWFKTRSSSPPCTLATLLSLQVHTVQQKSPSGVTIAGFHLELDFCQSKQPQVSIHVRDSMSACFNEAGHKGYM